MKTFAIYGAKKLSLLALFLLGITVVAFLLGILAPGDPALTVLTMDGTMEPTAEELANLRHQMGLDLPVYQQYVRWLVHVCAGDLGTSYLTGRPVLSEILRRFPVTFALSVCALGWVILLGIPCGVWAALHKGRAGEKIMQIGALLFISVPSFWLGILCMLLFSEEWRLLPSSGYGDALHMILPSFVLAAGTCAAVLRMQQASMLSVMDMDFVRTLRAKGLPFSYIAWHHVLPNALMPVITMVGTFFGSVLGGSVIVEDLFSIPGLGSYVLSAIWGRDYPVIQGYVMVSGTVFITFNYIIDMMYYVLNPSLRKEGD